MSCGFRCRTCRRLVEPEAAGERTLPAACPSCGAGVSFDPTTGAKVYQDDNWDVLAELAPRDLKPILAYHRIEASEIAAHVPVPAAGELREPQTIARDVIETVGLEDLVG